jgi:hypothetical protein
MAHTPTRREALAGAVCAVGVAALPPSLACALAQAPQNVIVLRYAPSPERMLERANHIAATTSREEREAWRLQMRRRMDEHLAKMEARV